MKLAWLEMRLWRGLEQNIPRYYPHPVVLKLALVTIASSLLEVPWDEMFYIT